MDAKIALELTKLKKQQGNLIHSNQTCYKVCCTGLEFGVPSQGPTRLEKLADILSDQNLTCCMIDRPENIKKYSGVKTHDFSCPSDATISDKLVSQIRRHNHFIWAQFQDLYRFYIARSTPTHNIP